MPQLPLLNTSTNKWRDPGTTNPRGWLAVDTAIHPAGGLEARDDDIGQGIGVRLLGEPSQREWPTGVPITAMPLHISTFNELWAAPYPPVVWASDSAPSLAAGAQAAAADAVLTISAPLEATITNDSPYPMLAMRRVIVQDARLISPRQPVDYALIVDGATASPWPLFSGTPSFQASIIPVSKNSGTTTLNGATNATYVESVTLANALIPAEHCYSGSLQLPAVLVDPGASYTCAVQTAIRYQTATDAFGVQVGATTLEVVGFAIVDNTFGQEA